MSATVAAQTLRGLPSGAVAIEGDGVGLDDGEGRSVDRVGGRRSVRPVAVVMMPCRARAAEEVDADEVGDVARPGSGGDLGERAGLHDPAGFEDHHPVGEGVGVDGVVGDEEADAVERGEVAAQVAAHVAAGAGVEGGQRLVEQQQPRLGGQRPGQRDPLRLPARQGSGSVAGVVGEPDALEPRRGACAGPSAFGTPRARRPNATFSSAVRLGNSR